MAYTKLIPRSTPGARVEKFPDGDADTMYRLSIPAGAADKYRLAQLDDYTKISRGRFPLRPPPSASLRTGLSLSLFARASSISIPGTWGFGLWNDPFGLSLGFGGNPFRLPALPNAVWFFGASEESYISFKAPRAERSDEGTSTLAHASTGGSGVEARNTQAGHASTTPPRGSSSAQRGNAENGFLAQAFRSPRFHPLLILAGLAFPFSRRTTRRLMGKVIHEDGVRLSVDATEWHRYTLDWRDDRVAFDVDHTLVFESSVSPRPPLGLVIWIDNQYAAFTPEGKIGFGVLENPEPAWLEIKDVEINT
jgi:hypothetical protein